MHYRNYIFLLFLWLFNGGTSVDGQIQYLPEDFYNQIVAEDLLHPTGLTFAPNGLGYIWRKKGVINVLDTMGNILQEPLIDISEEVVSNGDHGLLGLALDPNFEENGYFYLLYMVDRHHLLHFGTPEYDPATTIEKQATIGRITRYQADSANGFIKAIPNSRKILIGDEINENSFPLLMTSHGIGTLAFADDGTLIISCGDAGSFDSADIGNAAETYYQQALEDGIIREKDNIGSLRAQMVDNLAGKILRINPETGEGVPSNPFYDPENPNSPRSKVWAMGFRNPFRFIMIPETGSHNPDNGQPGIMVVGDVGSGAWEEINIVESGGQNFGWPMYEGMTEKWQFGWSGRTQNQDAPNPLFPSGSCKEFFDYQDLIQEEKEDGNYFFHNPCDSILPIPEDIPTFHHTRPLIAWSNVLWNQPTRAEVPGFDATGKAIPINIEDAMTGVEAMNFDGFSSIPGIFYTEGDFPDEYDNTLFITDFSGWVKTFHLDENYELLRIEDFMDRDTGIVDMRINPKDGCLYYVHFNSHSLQKICYGGDPPPVARLESDKLYGQSPLSVQFDASSSYSPKDYPLSYHWDFGDGQESSEIAPIHVFEASSSNPETFEVVLTVTDSLDHSSIKTIPISLNNTPPSVTITSLKDNDFYPVSDATYLNLEADVTDQETSEEALDYNWQIFLHHNTHFHQEPPILTRSAQTLLDPVGCGEEIFWYRIKLTVIDPNGLVGEDEVEIYPFCEDPFFEIINLSAEVQEEKILLSWESTFENEVEYYEIERTEDYKFSSIGIVEANGSSVYSFEDLQPFIGNNYYRIKANRVDGAYEYSNQLKIRYPQDGKDIRVFPNPNSGNFNVLVNFPVEEELTFELYNAKGQNLLERTWEANIGDAFTQNINLPQGHTGVFYYVVRNGDYEAKGKILVR